MTTMTCHHCHRPVKRSDAHLRSVVFKQVAICDSCHQLGEVVDAVLTEAMHDPEFIIAAHTRSVA